MYSVLIVDDEDPVLESYAYLVDSALEDFIVCGTARSGSEALTIAHRERPDVVLMDIAMPGIDGLDTIRELQHEFPDVLYILSTAYERFDLAQRAIPLRVFAYLVKPVSRKRFLETMFHAKDHLDEQRDRFDTGKSDGRQSEEEIEHDSAEFILQLSWRSFDETAWARYRRLFNLSGDGGIVVAVEVSSRELYPGIAQRIGLRYRCVWSEYMSRLLVLVAEQVSPEELRQFVTEAAGRVSGPADRIAVGVGSRHRYDELYRSCDEALSALPEIDDSEQLVRCHRAMVRDFARQIARARSIDDVESGYRALLEEVFSSSEYTVAIHRISALAERLLEELGQRIGDTDISNGRIDPARELPALESLPEIDAWLRRVLRWIIRTQSDRAGEMFPAVLAQATRYVDTRYASPIQLSTVAEYCGVSTGHLSRLFSEHLHSSFTDHLNTIRIDAAEQLLRTTRQSIREIAYAVGYHSPNYFSRIFRKHKGVPPTEYPRTGGGDE